ncbi:hypothetical protein B0T16DRAFT_489642 [Cercophora newfieldiana]|uniref:DUF2470 domain-containing protein n=1 Tax=Cercophora newfieldiana TaxID=92897 RepID=A0AA40CU65_9PEZI|nr:hypothetical protein B0T16DRAFT_489642 [Cercophora newfieldiana]
MSTEIPPAQKARTISHMNKDHRTDLAHILQHYNRLSAKHVSDPEPLMVDIDLHSITVTVGDETHLVEFKPPLATWDERRPRLVEMTMKAREALGVVTEGGGDHGGEHPVVVSEYRPPKGKDWFAFVGVCAYYASCAAVKFGAVEKGSVVWEVLEGVFPGGAGGFRWLVETIFLLVVGIHVTEMWWFDRTRGGKLKRGSGVWWAWMGSVFIEGVGAFWRFDGVVRRLKKAGKRG